MLCTDGHVIFCMHTVSTCTNNMRESSPLLFNSLRNRNTDEMKINKYDEIIEYPLECHNTHNPHPVETN